MALILEKIRCEATLEKLGELNQFVEECADRFGLDAKKKFGLLIAVEEAFVNICSYAYPGGAGEAEVSCASEGETLVLEIADSGSPFDVLSLPDPDTTLDVMEREIGGLGVYFIRKLTDDVSYRRENGRNILRLVFRH
jgi:anti-sigma regulatory factor (Ser/Thr protein kinase)